MLASLIDTQLSIQGQTRRCLASRMGAADVEQAISDLNRCLKYGTNDEVWLQRIAETLGLEKAKVQRANRVTLLMGRNREADNCELFTPYIEFVLEGVAKDDSLMMLTREQWIFSLDNTIEGEEKSFSLARKVYKREFIEHKGRCLNKKILGFRYYWAPKEALEFDIYGQVKNIVPVRMPPKKRFVSRRVLRTVGKPKLLVVS